LKNLIAFTIVSANVEGLTPSSTIILVTEVKHWGRVGGHLEEYRVNLHPRFNLSAVTNASFNSVVVDAVAPLPYLNARQPVRSGSKTVIAQKQND
jgi:hypothetical protein